MLSRDDFEKSCKDFLAKHVCSNNDVYSGWYWNEHSYLPRMGYLVRNRTIREAVKAQHDVDEEGALEMDKQEDPATASPPAEANFLEVCEHIVYSATFQVPAFYFLVCKESGSPMSLDKILASSLFRADVLGNAQNTSFAVQAPSQRFPLLSQGEHPTLGTPCWLFHPCETPNALTELMEADGSADTTRGEARLIELWLLLVGNVYNLQK